MTCSLVPFFTKLGTLTSFRTTEVVPEIEKRLVALVLTSSMVYVYACGTLESLEDLNFRLHRGHLIKVDFLLKDQE